MTFFGKKRPVDSQFDSEIHFHIERLIAGGLTPENARRQAMLEFGGREQIKEELRVVHRIVTLDNSLANIKSGLRLIRKSPSFSAAVILTLALGIGAVRSRIVARFLMQAMAVTALGCAVGLCLAFLSTRVLSGMLYGVSASDPQTFVFIPLLVLIVATIASFLPAVRAARVDPMQVLRDE
jgi:predicted lysophospholipase L1 biosynthesis ABC-type transport system permease subunit